MSEPQKTVEPPRNSEWSACFQIDAGHLHHQAITQSVADPGALSPQLVQRFVVQKIFGAELRHVHQALHI